MLKKDITKTTVDELKQIYILVGERKGWDFSRMKTESEVAPWDYLEIVKRYLRPKDYVLDIGTGGGEKFIELSNHFSKGVGIDPFEDMVRVARENASRMSNRKVSFKLMGAEHIDFPKNTFDIVLNRHAVVVPKEIAKVLKPGGYFITQQVTNNNMKNIKIAFKDNKKWKNDIITLTQSFKKYGCKVIGAGEYNISYWVKDVESLVFWLKAVNLPENFNIKEHGSQLVHYMKGNITEKGFVTNESREFLIAKKL